MARKRKKAKTIKKKSRFSVLLRDIAETIACYFVVLIIILYEKWRGLLLLVFLAVASFTTAFAVYYSVKYHRVMIANLIALGTIGLAFGNTEQQR